jgi:hypothetical protein
LCVAVNIFHFACFVLLGLIFMGYGLWVMSYSGGSYPILTALFSKSLKKIRLPENQEALSFLSEIKLSQRRN